MGEEFATGSPYSYFVILVPVAEPGVFSICFDLCAQLREIRPKFSGARGLDRLPNVQPATGGFTRDGAGSCGPGRVLLP